MAVLGRVADEYDGLDEGGGSAIAGRLQLSRGRGKLMITASRVTHGVAWRGRAAAGRGICCSFATQHRSLRAVTDRPELNRSARTHRLVAVLVWPWTPIYRAAWFRLSPSVRYSVDTISSMLFASSFICLVLLLRKTRLFIR